MQLNACFISSVKISIKKNAINIYDYSFLKKKKNNKRVFRSDQELQVILFLIGHFSSKIFYLILIYTGKIGNKKEKFRKHNFF